MKCIRIALILVQFVFIFSVNALATQLQAIQLNNKGVKELKQNNFSLAEGYFVDALRVDPFLSALHLNLGLSFESRQEMERAQSAYESAVKLSEQDELKFTAHFNLAQLFQKAKKTELALQNYQEALRLNPNSRETKVNIELLIQQQQQQSGQGKGDQQQKNDNSNQGQDNQQQNGDQQKDQPNSGEGPKTKGQAPKPKFNSEELTQADVNKILGEIKQQEQKIRGEFNRKEAKEKPRDKDW